jgi:polyisoprenoid-binding protein YceI
MQPVALIAAIVASALPAGPGSGPGFDVLPAGEGIRVHVAKRGLFSAFAHDHDFEVTRWRGSAEVPDGDPGRAVLELALAADSLRDRESGLSSDDRRKVDAQAAGPDVLDSAHAPEIAFRSEGVTLAGAGTAPLRGTMHGRLTLRGRTRPVDVTFEAIREADGWRVSGRGRFRQSEFGIRPFSGFGGTVAVKDEVEVTFALALRPRREARTAAPSGAATTPPSR